MDRVLVDCLILSTTIALILGGGAYLFGPELLKIILISSGYQLWYGDPSVYNSYLFSVRMDGSVPGISSWNGKINCADATFRNRNSRNENRLDLWNISKIQIVKDFVHFLSCILDHYDHPASDLLYFC